MKKIFFSAVLVTVALVSFDSCTKKKVESTHSLATPTNSLEKTICNLSDISAANYTALGTALCGASSGVGYSGAIDVKLNCNQSSGNTCNVVNATGLFVTTYTSGSPQGDVLSDGVMTAAEQQTLVSQIQSVCTTHKNSNYGSSYSITQYDVWFVQALCGGCPSEMMVMVNYTAAKQCR